MLALVLRETEALTIRRNATLILTRQFHNDGIIFIVAGDPHGSAQVYLGDEKIGVPSGGGVNKGTVVISPKLGFSSPGFNNRFELHNFGVIQNGADGDLAAGGVGGILNNFFNIFNHAYITNLGFLHNSGPKVQSLRALIQSDGLGLLFNQTGVLENLGVIKGNVIGNCSGICQ
jgi:hypothetical protein